MKKTILMATSAIVAAGFVATEASAVDVSMYGHVNKGVMLYDDGSDTEVNFVDNDKSSSRIGVRGSQALDNGLTASVLFEFQSQSTASNSIQQANPANTKPGAQNTPTASTGSLAERHSRVGLAGDFGAVFLGHTSTATDGIAEMDLAGVSDLMGSAVDRFGGNLLIRDNTGASTGTTVSELTENFDGIADGFGDRTSTIVYHSPTFQGFQGKIAAAQGGSMDAAVTYNGKIDAFQVKGGLGYVARNNATTTAANGVESTMAGSLSVKHDSGLAGTVAYGSNDLENKAANVDDASSVYVKVGYEWDAFSVAADYSKAENVDGSANDTELTSMGVGGQYNMGNGVSVAGMFRQFDADDNTATDYDEINVWVANLKVKF